MSINHSIFETEDFSTTTRYMAMPDLFGLKGVPEECGFKPKLSTLTTKNLDLTAGFNLPNVLYIPGEKSMFKIFNYSMGGAAL